MKHTRALSLLLSCALSMSLLVPMTPVHAANDDGSIRSLVDRVTGLTEAVQADIADEAALEALDEQQAAVEESADAADTAAAEAAEAAAAEDEEVTMMVVGGTINVRSGPGTGYERVTQVMTGKRVSVLGEESGWYHVSFGDTTGWILGDYLRDIGDLDGTAGAQIVEMAMQFLGVRYRSGGASPNGFDCSGFTLYLYAQLGYALPHSATSQYKNYGYTVDKADLQPGDLVFFSDSSHAIGHVGIYIGDGQIIHARYSVGKVTIDSLSSSYYTRRYVGAKRII